MMMGNQLLFSLDQVSRIRALLIQAGYCEPRHFILYLVIRGLSTLLGFGAVLLAVGLSSPLLLVGVTALGFSMPPFILNRMIRGRQKRIRLGFIDTLDLTALCVEGGLTPLQAMRHVAEDLRDRHPELSDELYPVCREMRAGSWDEALCGMSERTGVGEIRDLSELIRAEPFGVIRNLRSCADSLRAERGQHAKVKAMVPALVVFGAVFILPVILLVTRGPALIQLYRTLVS
jgi:tight adherence protein C